MNIARATTAASRPIRVLIVDDHPLFRRGMVQMLHEEETVEVVGEAGTGAAGLQLAADTEPDAVLMDYRMPGMNGDETTAALLARQPEIAVIGMSNDDHPQIRRNMLAAGAQHFLLKGTDVSQVLAALDEAVAS